VPSDSLTFSVSTLSDQSWEGHTNR